MIKKILLTLLLFIGCNCFFNNCFAWKDYGYVGNWRISNINSNISNEMLKNGSFLSEYLGDTYDSYLGGLNYYVFWTNDENYPIYYRFGGSYGTNEGYSVMFGICDSIIDTGGNFISDRAKNCTYQYFNSGYKNYLSGFFNSLSIGDIWAVLFGSNVGCGGYGSFCINNSSLNTALCFGNNYCGNGGENEFINSQGFGSFQNVPSSFIGVSPFAGGGGDSGGGDSSLNPVDYTCTKEIALKWYEKNGYSSKLCYGGFDNLNLFTGAVNDLPFYGSGLDIEEIWFNTAQYRIYGDIGSGMGYNDWFHYWRLVYNSYYRTINEGGVLDNPFENTPLVLFTYFSAVNQFGRNLKDKDILEYCDLKLYTSDYSAVYSGNYGHQVCSPLSWIEDSINRLNSSGDVNIGVNIGNFGTGNSGQNFTDGKSFIQSFVQFIDSDKFKGTNTGSSGIIPGYIVLILCALIFFRFLMH